MSEVRSRIHNLTPILRALDLGWKAHPRNANAVKHFYFDGPVKLEVHWFNHEPAFTVGDTTTTYMPRAVELIEAAAPRVSNV